MRGRPSLPSGTLYTIKLSEIGSEYVARNETFRFAVDQSTSKIHAWIWGHKTLGKDKLLGEADVDVRVPRAFAVIC